MVQQLPEKDQYSYTRAKMLSRLTILMGGRAAEELCLGEVSTGAASDLKQANAIARSMIAKYGMSDKLANMVFDDESNEVFIGMELGHSKSYSDETAKLIDDEVKKLIDDAYTRVMNILTENKQKLLKIADVLMEKEKIEGEEFDQLMEAAE